MLPLLLWMLINLTFLIVPNAGAVTKSKVPALVIDGKITRPGVIAPVAVTISTYDA
jgi:hypothetical protein